LLGLRNIRLQFFSPFWSPPVTFSKLGLHITSHQSVILTFFGVVHCKCQNHTFSNNFPGKKIWNEKNKNVTQTKQNNLLPSFYHVGIILQTKSGSRNTAADFLTKCRRICHFRRKADYFADYIYIS